VGLIAPASFMQHFIVFVLSVFIGFQVIWNVSHSLHTPLMASPTRSRRSSSSAR
jgi:NAD(P) transhydrogenase subunit alpha